jgi:hypothetical protein
MNVGTCRLQNGLKIGLERGVPTGSAASSQINVGLTFQGWPALRGRPAALFVLTFFFGIGPLAEENVPQRNYDNKR